MRVITQIGILALLAGGGAAWHLYGEQVGLPRPLALLGLEQTAGQAGDPGRPAGGGGLQVVAAPVRVGAVVERVESVGSARAREAITLTSRVSGIVSAIRFEEGQLVRAGDVLVEFDRSTQEAERDQARAQLDDARTRLNRARQLRATQAVPEAQIDQLEAALRQAEARLRQMEARIDEMKIVAPFAGRVGLRQVSLGALVQPGQAVTTLDDLSRMRIEFAVPEVFVARLSVGMPVVATSPAFGGRRFEGAVEVVDTRIDPATRSVKLVASFANPDEALKPGMFMNIELTLARRETAMLVPEEAIDPVADRAFVFAVRNGRAVRQEVKLGTRLAGEVEVLDGLAPDDQVVVRGLQRLRNGQPVTVTEVTRRPMS
ncbi:efflux RND transporter periplasmic adaptor subunit [Elioraea tepida]|jgi:membrane fusion protein (multidrug efflux system)|uniref:Efflux RND transporter periplasmic adaptor subunit n=1 Tax=Elioraea tepida TaxID=2843330 RepID=A0A975YJK9_9PROT|nr:efflux RND transporter periplasmic adaptor subunit [Elioraea tepida]QXM24895.1 efflux RND transporter periplasmic adaptor subunit [Elioraea tepida]